jgi:replication initiator protein A
LIDASSIRRKHGIDGRLVWCEIKLSDWVFNAIRAQEVLTLHRDYFRLRKPIERRVYEIARKHCGQQDSWKISVALLLKKSGSRSPEKRFRQMIRHLAEHNHLPDYSVSFDGETDMVTFRNRGSMGASPLPSSAWKGQLDADAYDLAREAAPSWDVYYLEREWGDGSVRTKLSLSTLSGFLKFCRTWYEKRGRA